VYVCMRERKRLNFSPTQPNQRNGDGKKQEKTGTQGSIQNSEHIYLISEQTMGAGILFWKHTLVLS